MVCDKEYKEIRDAESRIRDYLKKNPDSRIGHVSKDLRLERYICVRTLRKLQSKGLVYAVSKPTIIDGITWGYITLYGVVDEAKP